MKGKIIVTLYIKNVTGALYTVNYNEKHASQVTSHSHSMSSIVSSQSRRHRKMV